MQQEEGAGDMDEEQVKVQEGRMRVRSHKSSCVLVLAILPLGPGGEGRAVCKGKKNGGGRDKSGRDRRK